MLCLSLTVKPSTSTEATVAPPHSTECFNWTNQSAASTITSVTGHMLSTPWMREARVVGLLGPALLCYCAAASTFSSSGNQRIRDRSEIADSGTEVRGQRCVNYGLHDNQPTETVELQTYPSGVSTPGYNKPVALTLESTKLQRRTLQTQDRPAAVVKHENHRVPSGLCHAESRHTALPPRPDRVCQPVL